jgi:hypothetical protein
VPEEEATVRVTIRRFDEPDEAMAIALGQIDLVRIAGLSLGRARYEPGWRWSTHVGAAQGQRWCQTPHVGLVVAGRNRVEMTDGTHIEMGPGDIFDIGPGHDSVVVGDEPYESIHFVGADHYASTAADSAGTHGDASVD